MKKLLMLFCAGVLISVLCAGCNELKQDRQQDQQIEEGAEINPISVSKIGNEVANFFDKNTSLIAQTLYGFGGGLLDRCVMINSVEELPKIILEDGYSLEYPFIDFTTYTLVVGQYVTGGARYLSSQSIVAEQDVVTMNITVEDPGGLQSADVRVDYFWGLYPKIIAKAIDIKVTYKK